MLGNKINQLQPTVLPRRSVTVNDGKKMSTLDAFFTWGGMLLESVTMTNFSREIEEITDKWNNCMFKVLTRRILSNDKFCYLEMLAITI